MNAPAPLPVAPRWLVTARSEESHRRYLVHHTLDGEDARRARAEAQLLLDLLFPDQRWLVSLHTLTEVR